MSVMERNILENYVALDSTRILEVMHRDFVAMFHGVIDAHPYSMEYFCREMHKARLSLKVIERRNILCNDHSSYRCY